jgi:hypothetical protein
MLFGRSVFQSILTRLDHEQADDVVPSAEEGFRIAGLPAGFVAQPASAQTTARASDAYRDMLGDIDQDRAAKADTEAAPPAAPAEPECPTHLTRLSQAEIAQDLGLDDQDSPELLAEKRRSFARDNHPDLVHPLFRDKATIRMTLANMLVDQALRLAPLRR